MCFNIHTDHREVKTAEEDIVCYKFMDYDERTGYHYAPYMSTKYNYGMIYADPTLKDEFEMEVEGYSINEGIHSYTNRERCQSEKSSSYQTIIEVVIPKGTKYYLNPYNQQYVSTKVFFKDTRGIFTKLKYWWREL